MKPTTKCFLHGGLFALCSNLVCLGVFHLLMIIHSDSILIFFILYLSVIPIYIMLFSHRNWQVAFGTLVVNLLIAGTCLLLGIAFGNAFDDYLERIIPDSWAILGYVIEYFVRSFIGLVVPCIHLSIIAFKSLNRK